MPSRETVIAYAMYVVSEVESNWTWNAVSTFDGVSSTISIGITQNYGMNARDLLRRIQSDSPNDWATIQSEAPTLANQVMDDSLDWNWWSYRVLTQSEHDCLVSVLGTDGGKLAQQNMFSDMCNSYIDEALSIGMSLDQPKQIIYYIRMRHHNPASAQRIMATCGGTATLQYIHQVRANDPVIGASMFTRSYNIVYDRLVAWDGESGPPDYGQVEGPTGDGGNSPGIGTKNEKLTHIIRRGNMLVVYGKDEYEDGVIFYESTNDVWKAGINKDGTPIEPGHTDSGNETGNKALQDIVALIKGMVNTLDYSQGGGRLSPDTSGYSDCSALICWAYNKIAGVQTGTWTGDMLNYGRMIAQGGSGDQIPPMNLGDGLLITWSGSNPSFDHVAIYCGNNEIWGHGYAPGPHIESTNAPMYAIEAGISQWQVRRWIES